jgi:hypothetical protein
MMQNKEILMTLFTFNKGDINWQTAYNAHTNTSHDPDKRANDIQQGYVNFMRQINNEFYEFVTDENKGDIAQDLEEFKRGYIKRKTDRLIAGSRVASSMIAGPANFNVSRNKKRLNIEHKRLTELLDWSNKQLSKLRRKYDPQISEIIYSDDEKAIQKLEDKIERLKVNHNEMKKCNKLLRKHKALGRDEIAQKLRDGGIGNSTIDIALTPSPVTGDIGFQGFHLANSNAQIKNTEARLKQLKKEAMRPEAEDVAGNGWRLVENKEDMRLQFFFDGVPTKEVRTFLGRVKRFSFARSWDGKPWQRKITPAARTAANEVVKFLNKQERVLEYELRD